MTPPHLPDLTAPLVILAACGIVIPAFARLRVTPVVGFILTGLLVGPFGLGRWQEDAPWLRWVTIADPAKVAPIAELGIVLLLFSIGLELSARRLWQMRRALVGFGVPELFGGAMLIALGLAALGNSWGAALGLGLALTLSSTALVLPMSGTRSPVGRLAFAMLMVEDLALVPIVFALSVLGGRNAQLADLVQPLLIGGGVVAALLLIGPRLLPPLFAQAVRARAPEMFLSAALLVVIAAALATMLAGLSPIIGALVAGIAIAETDYAQEIEAVIRPIAGLALGVFLMTVGMQIDPAFVIAHWPALLLALAVVLALKMLVTGGLLVIGGVPRGVAIETSVMMASPSETTLIVLAAAVAAGLIHGEAANFWQVVTALGLTLTPLLARGGRSLARRIDRAQHVADQPVAPTHVVIVGYGRVGAMVGDLLDAHGKPWLAIDANIDTVRDARAAGKPVRYADTSRRGAVDALGLDRALAVAITMRDPVQALALTRTLRRKRPDLQIIARARDADHAAELYQAGVSDAVPETLEASLQLAESVLLDLGLPAGPVIASIHEQREVLRGAIKDAGGLDAAPSLRPAAVRRD